MATDKRTPDDLQEAVAATLRRLRGEGTAQPKATERTEPQLSSAPSITVSGATPKTPSNSPTGGASMAPPAPASSLEAEPDLLSVANVGPEDAASPGSRATVLKQARAAFAPEPEKPRPPVLRYVAALAALLVFGGVVWWAYHAFIGRPKNGEVPMIAADQTPEKVAPSDQTATAAPDQDKTIYNQISPGSVPASKGEVLLPQPELPQAPPAPPSPAPSATDLTGGFVADQPAASQGGGQPSTDQSAAAGQAGSGQTSSNQATSGATLGPAPAEPAPAPTDTPAADAAAPDNATLAPAAPPPPAPAPAAAAKADSATAAGGASAGSSTAPAKTQSAMAPGNYRIQLAALKTESAAKKTWKRLLAKHKGVLGPLSLQIERADLGTQGIYYRLEAGPFAEKTAAKAACTKLKAQGQQCLVKP